MVTRPSSLVRGLALLPGLLLVLGLVAGGLHHHVREDDSHACAICALSHAPATTTVAVAAPAPETRVERVTLAAVVAPRAARPAAHRGRAPPSA